MNDFSGSPKCWTYLFIHLSEEGQCTFDYLLAYNHVFFSTADPYVHLDKCTIFFDEARLDQRFEILDESIVSICSKYAKSKL